MLKEPKFTTIVCVCASLFRKMANTNTTLLDVLQKVEIKIADKKIPLSLFLLHVCLNLNPCSEENEKNTLVIKYVELQNQQDKLKNEFSQWSSPEESPKKGSFFTWNNIISKKLQNNNPSIVQTEKIFNVAYDQIAFKSMNQHVIPNTNTKNKVRKKSIKCVTQFTYDLNKCYGKLKRTQKNNTWVETLYNTLWSIAYKINNHEEDGEKSILTNNNKMMINITVMLLMCHLTYCTRIVSIENPTPIFPAHQPSDKPITITTDPSMLIAHTIYWMSKVNNPDNVIDMSTVTDTSISNLVCDVRMNKFTKHRTATMYKKFVNGDKNNDPTNTKELSPKGKINYPAIWVLAYAHLQYINIVDMDTESEPVTEINVNDINTNLQSLVDKYDNNDSNSNDKLSLTKDDVARYVQKFRNQKLEDELQYELYGAKYVLYSEDDESRKSEWFHINRTVYMLHLVGYQQCKIASRSWLSTNMFYQKRIIGGGGTRKRAYRDKVERLVNRHYNVWTRTTDSYIIPLRQAHITIHPTRAHITVRHRNHLRPVVFSFKDNGRQVTIYNHRLLL